METTPDFLKFLKGEPRISLRTGDVLFQIGDQADCMYCVEEGVVLIGTGQFVFEEAKAGMIVGEMGVIDDTMRSATGWAGTECTLVKVSIARFNEIITQNPDFALAILRVVARRLRNMNRRIYSIESVLKTAPEEFN